MRIITDHYKPTAVSPQPHTSQAQSNVTRMSTDAGNMLVAAHENSTDQYVNDIMKEQGVDEDDDLTIEER